MKNHATAEELSAFLDGELAREKSRRVEDHLAACGECRGRLDSLGRVVTHLQRLERMTPPEGLFHQVERQVARQGRRLSLLERLEGRLEGWDLQPTLAVTFALILALATIVYLYSVGLERQQSRRTAVVISPEAEAPGRGERESPQEEPSPVEEGRPAEYLARVEERSAAARPSPSPVAPPPAEEPAPERTESLQLRMAPEAARDLLLDAPPELKREKAGEEAKKLSEGPLQTVAGRTFELRGTTWWERGIEGEPVVQLRATDPRGQEILALDPQLEEMLEEAGALVLLWEGEVVELRRE